MGVFFPIFCLFAFAHGVMGKKKTCGDQSELDLSITNQTEIDEVLLAHNNQRHAEMASNEFKLEWDDSLALRAQQWADECTWEHDMLYDCKGKALGQNMYMSGGGNNYPKINFTAYVESWVSEIEMYTYRNNSCQGICGHYTQVVWATTLRIGCAFKKCKHMYFDGEKMSDYTHFINFVCDYSPPGNVIGMKPFKYGTGCDKCAEEMKKFGGNFCHYRCKDEMCELCEEGQDECDAVEECICHDVKIYKKHCHHWEANGFCNSTIPIIREHTHKLCPRTCGACDGTK